MKKSKARYTLIKGQFWIHNPAKPRQGPQPDGDTVTFIPDSLELVKKLPRLSGRPPALKNGGKINVRYEGIDTLETHFAGTHQNLELANAARDRNLAQLGFTNVRFYPDEPNVVQAVDQNPLPGYVLANGIESNGRLLGLVYKGATPRPDGERIFVDNAILEQSVNFKLVQSGLAYAEPYDSMPIALVRHLRTVTHHIRNTQEGLWAVEGVTTDAATVIQNLDDLQALVMWPKLFRRLATYFDAGYSGLGQFEAWLRDDPIGRDDALRLPDGEKGNMHDTFEIDGDSLQLQFNPEDLLIAPDPK
jgi:hypothetical protein